VILDDGFKVCLPVTREFRQGVLVAVVLDEGYEVCVPKGRGA